MRQQKQCRQKKAAPHNSAANHQTTRLRLPKVCHYICFIPTGYDASNDLICVTEEYRKSGDKPVFRRSHGPVLHGLGGQISNRLRVFGRLQGGIKHVAIGSQKICTCAVRACVIDDLCHGVGNCRFVPKLNRTAKLLGQKPRDLDRTCAKRFSSQGFLIVCLVDCDRCYNRYNTNHHHQRAFDKQTIEGVVPEFKAFF
ncbi:MAG: hypothetical protein WBV71_11790 [Roseobacter sp.]